MIIFDIFFIEILESKVFISIDFAYFAGILYLQIAL
jgi:hypothetical protein